MTGTICSAGEREYGRLDAKDERAGTYSCTDGTVIFEPANPVEILLRATGIHAAFADSESNVYSLSGKPLLFGRPGSRTGVNG